MRSPFYFYRKWMIYWEPVEGCYFARPPAGVRVSPVDFGYIKFPTSSGLGRVCDHIRQRSLAGRVSA